LIDLPSANAASGYRLLPYDLGEMLLGRFRERLTTGLGLFGDGFLVDRRPARGRRLCQGLARATQRFAESIECEGKALLGGLGLFCPERADDLVTDDDGVVFVAREQADPLPSGEGPVAPSCRDVDPALVGTG
jgi:hypothetical protein